MALRSLIPANFEDQIKRWLLEDIPSFDYSAAVVGDKPEVAFLYGKSEGVLSGVPFFDMVFKLLNCTVKWNTSEGEYLFPKPGREGYIHVATVTGKASDILTGERLALNILAISSGIAFRSRRFADLAASVEGFHGKVAATRKVTPGFRLVQKYSVLVGGCDPHRMDLSSMIMLKDNAIDSCGSISAAVQKAKRLGGFSLKIEVECRSLEDALEAAEAGADVVMLDNFSPEEAVHVSHKIKEKFPHILIEVSGGITEENATQYMGPCVDILSSSSLIQGAPVVDFSLKIQKSN